GGDADLRVQGRRDAGGVLGLDELHDRDAGELFHRPDRSADRRGLGMDNAIYATLSRQSGLMREMQVLAHNIANTSTTGFRREGVSFAEHVRAAGDGPSLSMPHASARHVDLAQGDLTQTGAPFDMAIRGEGFFLVETPQGQRLTRAGSFTPNAEGELV